VFDHRHYVPCLKLKAGEVAALQGLSPKTLAGLTPLIELPSVDWDFEEDAPRRTLPAHLERCARFLAEAWPFRDRPVFVDVLRYLDGEVGRFLDAASGLLAVVPVVELPAAPQDLAAARAGQYGVCLRVPLGEVQGEDLGALFGSALDELQLPPAEVDLVLDMGYLDETMAHAYSIALPWVLGSLPHLKAWRTLTLLGTSFPADLREVSKLGEIPRREWSLWRALTKVPRRPTFGDYAIAHPELLEANPRSLRSRAAIRYTHDESWVVSRGVRVPRSDLWVTITSAPPLRTNSTISRKMGRSRLARVEAEWDSTKVSTTLKPCFSAYSSRVLTWALSE
jgi:hypothetical protein